MKGGGALLKLKIGVKIGLGFGIMLGLIILLSANSFLSLKTAKENIENMDLASQRLILGLKINNEFTSAVSAIRGYIAYGDNKYLQQLDKASQQTIDLENQLLRISRTEKKQHVQNLIKATSQWRDQIQASLVPVVKEMQQEMAAGNHARAEQLRAESVLVARQIIPLAEQVSSMSGTVVIENEDIFKQNLNSSELTANQVMRVSLIISLLAVIIGIVLAVLITRMVRKPIQQMLAGAVKCADGNFQDSIEVRSTDELGELATALNQMQANFREVIQRLKDSSAHLKDASEQLASQAEQTSSGATATAATMNEIATTVENMAENTQAVSEKANLASTHADQGQQGIQLITDQMNEMAAASGQVGTSINNLNAALAKIGQFVEVITTIAEQTNLLALNAAIEAARAGEAGKGFAVVAEEVRKLAEQSAKSTEEIRQLIGDINQYAQQSVDAMTAGAEKVAQGNRVVSEVGQNFINIIQAVQELSGQVQSMAASAQQVSAGVQNVAATTEEQTAAMEEVASAAASLNQLADELNSLVDKFKI